MKFYSQILTVVLLTTGFISCKKESIDNSIDGRFKGSWVESTEEKVAVVVSNPPAGNENYPNFTVNAGSTTYFYRYRFNATGDSIFLSDLSTGGTKNVPYKIVFSEDYRSFSIKKFHSALPNIELVVFEKQN